jgi:hypothetical protein
MGETSQEVVLVGSEITVALLLVSGGLEREAAKNPKRGKFDDLHGEQRSVFNQDREQQHAASEANRQIPRNPRRPTHPASSAEMPNGPKPSAIARNPLTITNH